MEIRTLSSDDIEEYRKLRLKGLKSDPSAFGSTFESEKDLSIEKFRKRLKSTKSNYIVGGFVDGKLVCVASFNRWVGPKIKHKGSISGMYCEKEFRGTGVAKEVVDLHIEKAKKIDNLLIINLMVVSENQRAISFYESFGFKKYGIEPMAMYDGERFYDEDLMYLEVGIQ